MYVCVCHGVTERHIEAAVQQGARHLQDLRRVLKVTAKCGRCAECARDCLRDTLGPVLATIPYESSISLALAEA
jgi:bacterioferritin-associated ferredoxin